MGKRGKARGMHYQSYFNYKRAKERLCGISKILVQILIMQPAATHVFS